MQDDRTPAARKANYVGGRAKDESKLSTKPSQIRNRLRRKSAKFEADLELYGKHVYGKQISEWDFEELARGKPRNKNGTFQGAPPKWITPAIAREAKRRLVEETHGILASHINQAIVTMGNLLISEEVDDKGRPIVDAKTKYAAAAFIIEHFIGKPKAFVELSAAEDVTATAIASAIVLDDGQPQDQTGYIEGEWEEENDDDE